MKKIGLTFVLILILNFIGKSQTTRYFEFTTDCGHGNWQDSTFVASTSNQVVIDTVLANIAKPLNERKFISGSIDYGHGGHNHNATHWFSWHFIPDQWNLVDATVELCDACPYTDVDGNTSYWVDNVGQLCIWSGKPVKEISNPLDINDPVLESKIIIYPNPAKDIINVKWNNSNKISITIYNTIGQKIKNIFLTNQNRKIDISELEHGIYFLKISDKHKTGIKKLVIDRD